MTIKEIKVCSVESCLNPAIERGWCKKHYTRWWRYGDLTTNLRPELEQSAIERFWAKVRRLSDGDCWNWLGARVTAGYGQFRVNGSLYYAHRYSYEIHYGPVPDGMFICHGCDNPLCVNPLHLFVGTQSDNMIDMWNKGRHYDNSDKG